MITCPYDLSLPPPWVRKMCRSGFDPRGCVLWGYYSISSTSFGFPLPLTPITAHKIAVRVRGVDILLQIWEEVGVPVGKYFHVCSGLTTLTKSTNIRISNQPRRLT